MYIRRTVRCKLLFVIPVKYITGIALNYFTLVTGNVELFVFSGSVAVHCLPVDLFCTAVCEYRTNALMWLLGHFAVHGHSTGAQSHTAADLGVCDVIGNNH